MVFRKWNALYGQSMEKLFLELGGKIHYNKEVQEILFENKKVLGIKTKEENIKSDYVISNADFPYTMKQLIKDEKNKGKYTNDKIDSMDYSCSCLIFYWGVDGTFEDLKTHNFIIGEDLDDNLKKIFEGKLVEDPTMYLEIPSNADKSLAPEGKSSFYLLIPTSELEISEFSWDEETVDYYRQKAFNTLSKLPGLENIKNIIELEKVFTPEDFERKFNAYRGATFGLQPTLKQSNYWRPQSKSKEVEGLYFTGSSTHPGAGVPIVIEGGRICAEELRRDEKEDGF